VATRLTLRTRELPEYVGLAFAEIKANSDEAFRRLIARFTEFYAAALFNRHWGESVVFGSNNTLGLHLVFHDLSEAQARDAFNPFLDFVAAAQSYYTIVDPMSIITVPARHWWDPAYLSKNMSGIVVHDTRHGAPQPDIWYQGDAGQAGWFIHGYESAWLPATMLSGGRRAQLNAVLFAATRQWHVALHFNKGLAGAPSDAIDTVRETPMNPAVAEAFPLAIIGAGAPPAFPGMPGVGPDLALARRNAASVARAIEGDPQRHSERRVIRVRGRLLRPGLAAPILRRQLPTLAGREAPLRPGWPVHHAPRCGQRGLEHGRVHPSLSRCPYVTARARRFQRL
jgi:hypothetical protein